MRNTETILISGCPRSGTSWIHFLLGSHPNTVTCRETHVYAKYVGPLKDWFDRENQLKGADGLSALFSEDEFIHDILSPIVNTTFTRIGSGKKNNQVILEKTPGNILYHRLIHQIQPDAKILFIVRDPRAVYASFKAASKQDWGGWTQKSVGQFCVSWNKYADAYLAAKSYRSTDSLMCVRYEDMKTDGSKWLAMIYSWAGLKQAGDLVQQVLEKNKIENLRNADKGSIQYDERADFYRVGKAYGWVDELGLDEIREVESNCMDLMTHMGYSAHTPAPSP
ncbi:sulfotransferase [Oceaniovalibus sp. ACAM 378]|uniref:sulfotransferase family protein n=1 Tax=Oceaniovalibus sp. ACAM 378 TaxID=2599923 RepID=UPI0011D9CE05|nr:sulfotransferase [Oceaniovalibus sp. ACAM 378]TYB82672.1 sulfotransferase [Oceaniovalibus sp. ACAM 378]